MKPIRFALAALVAANCISVLPAVAGTRQSEPERPHAERIVSADSTVGYDDLLDAIRRNNPSLRAARLGASALSADERRAMALPDPMVMFTYQPLPVLTAKGSQRSQVRVEQGFPYPGKRQLKRDLSRLAAGAAESTADALELDLLYRARLAWLEIRHVSLIERHIESFQSRLRDYEDAASQQYAVGSGPQQPILKAQLEGTSLLRIRMDLQARAAVARETLRGIVGTEITIRTTDEFEVTLPQLESAALADVARSKRPEFETLRLMTLNADAAIALARKDYMPDFGVNVTWFDIAPESVPQTATGRDAFAVGVSVKVPLWRESRAAGVEQQRLKQQQVEARQEALELEVQTRIAELLAKIAIDAEQLKLYEQALIPQATLTVEATMSAYSTGRADFLSLLDSERMLFSLNTGYEEARTRYLTTRAQLERVLGVTTLTQL